MLDLVDIRVGDYLMLLDVLLLFKWIHMDLMATCISRNTLVIDERVIVFSLLLIVLRIFSLFLLFNVTF